jgi:hypothetical protein
MNNIIIQKRNSYVRYISTAIIFYGNVVILMARKYQLRGVKFKI